MKPKIKWVNQGFGIMYGFVSGLKMFSIDGGKIPILLLTEIGTKRLSKARLRDVSSAKKYAVLYLKAVLDKIEYE